MQGLTQGSGGGMPQPPDVSHVMLLTLTFAFACLPCMTAQDGIICLIAGWTVI